MTNIVTTAMLQLRDVLTCSLHRAEYHKTECCKECQKDKVEEEIPEEDKSAKFIPLVLEEAGDQRVLLKP